MFSYVWPILSKFQTNIPVREILDNLVGLKKPSTFPHLLGDLHTPTIPATLRPPSSIIVHWTSSLLTQTKNSKHIRIMTHGCQKASSWHTTVRPWSPSHFTTVKSSSRAITRVDQPVSEQCCGKQFKMASDQLVTFPAVTYVVHSGDICIELCNQLIWPGSTDLCIVLHFISFGGHWSNFLLFTLYSCRRFGSATLDRKLRI